MGLEVGAIIAASSAFFSTTIVGSFTVGQLLLTIALTGAQYAMASLQKKRGIGGFDQSIKQNVKQADAPQRMVLGAARLGGAAFFYETKNPWLYAGFVYHAGQISGVKAWYINGKPLMVDGAGRAVSGSFRRADGTVLVTVSFVPGSAGQAMDAQLAADFPSLPASFRQRGHARAVFKCHYGSGRDEHDAIYGSTGQLDPLGELYGAVVYDPRDPAQDRDDPATWKWSDTAALLIAHYLRSPFCKIAADRIDWTWVAASANRDDEPVALKAGGWQKRYTINGVIDSSQPPETVIKSLLTANRGRLIQTGRKLRIVSGGAQPPAGQRNIMTIDDSMITGGVEFRSAAARAQLINRLRTEFIAPEREWTTANGPVLDFPDLQAEDGAIYEQSIQLPFTESHQRAQRLALAFLLDARYGRHATLAVSLAGLELEGGDLVQLSLSWLPAAEGLYVVERADLADGGNSIALSLSEFSDDIENGWIPDQDEQPFEIAPAEV